MIALLQRVSRAYVEVEQQRVAGIGRGILALVGVERGDREHEADRLLARMLGYRIFEDGQGRMNLSLNQIEGDLLLVPQFTLVADTRKGLRPSFTPAASPQHGERLFDHLVERARAYHPRVEAGRFGAHMQVGLVNDGPVTFRLQVSPKRGGEESGCSA